MGSSGDAVVSPFVAKTYEMVSDPRTEAMIRWGARNNSFIVLEPALFSQLLLPYYFKHGNFSSFVRQLNTYGFRKVDPGKWEFAHQSFLQGQIHLLRLIVRRRKRGDSSKNVDREDDGLMLLQEIERLRREQLFWDEELQNMSRRLQITERRPHQIISFLAKLVDNPDILPSFSTLRTEVERPHLCVTSSDAAATGGFIANPAGIGFDVENEEMQLRFSPELGVPEPVMFPFSLFG